jgi:hypothetical protein
MSCRTRMVRLRGTIGAPTTKRFRRDFAKDGMDAWQACCVCRVHREVQFLKGKVALISRGPSFQDHAEGANGRRHCCRLLQRGE